MPTLLAALVIICAIGDTQVQPPVVEPFGLISAEDIGTLRSTLDACRHEWQLHLASGGEFQNLHYKRLISNGGTLLYWGGVYRQKKASSHSFSSSDAPSEGHYLFAYLHTLGMAASTPPDQLFFSVKRGMSPSRVWNSLRRVSELDFLIFTLAEFESGNGSGPLGVLPQWFEDSSSLVLESIRIGGTGTEVWIDLGFRDGLTPGAPVITYRVSAVQTPTGFEQVIVQ